MLIKNVKKMFVAFMVMALITVNFSSCKEDLTKKEMLTGIWNVTYLVIPMNNAPVVIIPNPEGVEATMVMTFNSDGSYSGVQKMNFGLGEQTNNLSGTWSFNSTETKLTITENGEEPDVSDIIILTKSDCHLKSEDGITEIIATKQ